MAAPQASTTTRNSSTIKEEAWLQAIEDATSCCLWTTGHRPRAPSSDRQYQLDHCLTYLERLEGLLREHKEHKWDRPPVGYPPRLEENDNNNNNHGALSQNTNGNGLNGPNGSGNLNPPWNRSNNPFATFQDDDDEEEEESSSNDRDDEEAGDQPLLNVAPAVNSNNHKPRMDIRRLLIRVLSAQSDITAARATGFRQNREWLLGAEQYALSLDKIHAALELADSQLSRWMMAGTDSTNNSNNNNQERLVMEALSYDAIIVHVAVQYLTTEHERYLVAAQQRQRYLERKLEPHYKSRDEVKQRIGEERWNNNPHPKLDYARLRQEAEQELQLVQNALERLAQLQVDANQAEASTLQLKQKLEWSTTSNEEEQSQQQQQDRERYNGTRPSPTLLARRMDMNMYPDPTLFGWTFTGSCGAAEFFEKIFDSGNVDVVVKLDWYFTTGTIKTSLHHPTQGKTQLFGANVDETTYRDILENPRTHTGERYHQRRGGGRGGSGRGRGRGRENGGGRGRGRENGGGRGRGRGRWRGGQGRGRGRGSAGIQGEIEI